jgi:hypothetical protein
MARVKDIDSFYNFIGYVVLSAPNSFPVEDYLSPGDQMNLDRAFVELRRGVTMIDAGVANEEKLKTINSLIDQAYAAYKNGDEVNGAHLLQDMEAMIFKKV